MRDQQKVTWYKTKTFSPFSRGDIALIWLAVMGQNLILNMNDHGFTVVAYNRTVSKVEDFLNNEAKGTKIIGASSLKDVISKLKKPRRVMMLVKGTRTTCVTFTAMTLRRNNALHNFALLELPAGSAVDDFIKQLLPLMERGDIIIDGGNSQYKDAERRTKECEAQGILFVGSGVSGGEEGARYGPSLMPGGNKEAWPHIKPIFQGIAAKVSSSRTSSRRLDRSCW